MSTWIAMLFAAHFAVAAAPAESGWVALKDRADRAFNNEDWAVAEVQYRKVYKQAKAEAASAQDQADVLNQLGRTLYQREKLDEAREVYQQGLDLHTRAGSADTPDAGAIWFNLGHVHADLEQNKEAEYAYKRCLEIEETALGKDDLELAVTLAQLGNFLGRIHEYDRADPYLERAAVIREKHQDSTWGNTLQDWAVNRYRLEDYERAITLAQQAVEHSADDAEVRGLAYNVMAMSYESKQDYAKAGANYRYALKLLREALGYQDEQFKSVASNYADMAIDHDPSWGAEAEQ